MYSTRSCQTATVLDINMGENLQHNRHIFSGNLMNLI